MSQTVLAEQSAVFAVIASGSATIAYQWYEDGKAISGATASSYTVSKAPYVMSGAQFSVAVSTPSETLTSQTAILTVNPITPDLAFAPIAAQVVGGASFPVSATSLSKGEITYSVLSGPATIFGSMVTLTDAGSVVISATQAPSGDYSAATASAALAAAASVSVSSITPANQTMGPGRQAFAATASGGLTDGIKWSATSGSFVDNVWTSPVNAGKYTITATSADDPTKSASTTITISPPVITRQPASASICSNGNATLSVGAMYDRTYQWARNGTPLNGATGATYLIAGANAALDAGAYTVSVSNPAGSVTSATATMAVGSSIVSDPSNASAAVGQTATFSVAAAGKSPFSFQWFRTPSQGSGGDPIAGAVSDSYTTPTLSTSNNSDRYFAAVTDSCGTTVASTAAILSVHTNNVSPTIITQPLGQTVPAGGAASFSVVASGTPTLTYQWYRVPEGEDAGAPIPGVTAASYRLPSSATTIQNDQDAYYVTVTNSFGEAASLRAVLTVDAGITILQQPVSLNVNVGDTATFSVSATSALPLTYQWYQAPSGSDTFSPVPSATNATYTVPSAPASLSGSTYYVIVSNGVTASVQSGSAALFVGQLTGVNSCPSWNLIGDATFIGNCSYQLTESQPTLEGEIVWPTLISTANIQLSFTIATSESSPTPADGFAVVLGDPSLGATPTSIGFAGEGLGARGIPGLVIAFDDFENDWNGSDFPQDPQVPYLGVGRGDALWENPYFLVSTNIPPLADPSGQTISHDYVLHIVNGHMTVAIDGTQVLSGDVNVPPVAYLYATASTGASWEKTVISNISAVVSSASQ